VYGQNPAAGWNQTNTGMTSFTGTQNFHTANYRGNQQGHDSYLRSDSRQPSQFGLVSNYAQSSFTPSYSTFNNNPLGTTGESSYSQNLNQNQFVSPDSYHTSSYKGNQQGHDSYLRSDSTQPTLSKMGISASGTGFGHAAASNFSGINNNIGATTFGGSALGTISSGNWNPSNVSSYNQNQNQFVSPQSYHTANYKGNQQGHDNYLRADSTQPSQSQFGMGATGGFGTYNTANRF
jgi:uncharacterized SAM-dependent methyltransferase